MSYGRDGSSPAVHYEAPLRCASCLTEIVKKPKAKTPKYCPPCRHKQQEAYKQQTRKSRRY